MSNSRIVNTTIGVGRSGQAASFKAAADVATYAAANVAANVVISLPQRYLAAVGSGGLATLGSGGLAAVGSGGLVAVGSVGLAAVDYGVKYCASRLNSDIGVRSDAVIVPVEELCIRIRHADNVSKED
ncbi:hypothetical protein SLEP1_g13000 [Rubroshorea leprosula]|uniref:Uncharacterized protein n=1 Tax=Rubroshorea leprosula TaxID=152421 RepID=A0AAV5INH6_9ROSI|nr:hypothetical protein SLEP1_g13000 [Rubroshorea leprosula]